MIMLVDNILIGLIMSLSVIVSFLLLIIAPEEARDNLRFFKSLLISSIGAIALISLIVKSYTNAIIFIIATIILSGLVFKKYLSRITLLLLSSYMILTAIALKNEWLSASVFLFIISMELILLFDEFKKHFSKKTKSLKRSVKLFMLRRTAADSVVLFMFTLILLIIKAIFLNH
jgi:hypothetical protein